MENKVVLISGGTGSFGQEFVKQALKLNPERIRVLARGEYEMVEMKQGYERNDRLRFLIGDVRDKERLSRAMSGVDYVIHAAALKHIDLCEYNPTEAVKTNALGTINVIEAAIDNGVEKVMAISSDKAVHPINIYGATKLVMEKVFIRANAYSKTKFSCCRFGNFYGSRGSVIPKMLEQAEEGEITVTHKDMARYFITLQEAALFTIDCMKKMEGGEIFIPKMPETKMVDIINRIAPDAEWNVIGKRPGEKLHELLFSEYEKEYVQEFDDYFVIKGTLEEVNW